MTSELFDVICGLAYAAGAVALLFLLTALADDDDRGPPRAGGALCMAALAAGSTLATLAAMPIGSVASIAGLPGCGKTHLASQLADTAERVVIFDPYAARDRLNVARGVAERVTWAGDLVTVEDLRADVLESAESGTPSMLDLRPLRLVVQPSTLEPKALGKEWALLAEMIWGTGGGILFINEEAALYSHKAGPMLKQVATGGAHGGLRVVLISQRIGGIHPDARTQCGVIAQGPVVDELDREALRQKSPAFLARVETLREGERRLLFWRAGGMMGG